LRPAGAQLEFDAEKIADLPKHAVFHFTGQLTVRIADEQRGSERNGALYLEAGATERNVFEVRDAMTGTAGLVLKLDVHQVRTQHPGFHTSIEHIYLNHRPETVID